MKKYFIVLLILFFIFSFSVSSFAVEYSYPSWSVMGSSSTFKYGNYMDNFDRYSAVIPVTLNGINYAHIINSKVPFYLFFTDGRITVDIPLDSKSYWIEGEYQLYQHLANDTEFLKSSGTIKAYQDPLGHYTPVFSSNFTIKSLTTFPYKFNTTYEPVVDFSGILTNFSTVFYQSDPLTYGFDESNIVSGGNLTPPDYTSWVDLQYPDNYTFYDEFINHETGPFLQISYNQIQDISRIYLNGKTIFANKKYSWLGYENDSIIDFIEGDPNTLTNGTLQISLYDEALNMFTKTNNKIIIEYTLENGLYADTYNSEFNFTFGSGGIGNDFTDVELIGDTIFEGIEKPALTDGIGAWIDYFVKMVLAIVTAPFRLITLAVQNLNTYIGNFAESITAIFNFFPLWLNSLILTSLTIGIFMRVLGR